MQAANTSAGGSPWDVVMAGSAQGVLLRAPSEPLVGAIRTARNPAQTVAEHRNRHPGEPPEADWIKPRLVWMIVSSADSWVRWVSSTCWKSASPD